MMTSSNGNILRVTGLLRGNLPVTDNWPFAGGFHRSPLDSPYKKPVMRSFDVYFDLRVNKRLSKQSRSRWFRRHHAHYDATLMWSLQEKSHVQLLWSISWEWRHMRVNGCPISGCFYVAASDKTKGLKASITSNDHSDEIPDMYIVYSRFVGA